MVKIDSALRHNEIRIGSSIGSQTFEEKDIYQFSESVLKELSQNNIPSIPTNYSIYFDKLLDERGGEFKEKLGGALASYEAGPVIHEGHIYIEKEIKHSFGQIKSMLQAVALIYKNLGLMKGITKKHLQTLQSNTDILATQNVISAFNEDLAKLNSLMDKHIDVIKLNYEEIGKMFKLIEEQAIYDSNYDVYNKKFLLSTLEGEIDSVKRYGYSSSFLIIKPSHKVMAKVKNLKDKSAVLKNIANLLLRTSRRSDTVAHYGDGVFVVVMRHTDKNGATQACNRIEHMLSDIVIENDNEKIKVATQIVVGTLDKSSIMEALLSRALDVLEHEAAETSPVFLDDL